MSKNTDTPSTPSAKRKSRRKVGAGGTAAEPRVKKPGPGRPRNTVAAPRLAAFLAAIPEVCGVFGMDPAGLLGRNPAYGPREAATLALRKHCLGAIAALGRALDMPWGSMPESDLPTYLRGAHKTTISSFLTQFYQWTGLDAGEGVLGTPASEVAGFVLARYKQIREAAIIAAGGGAAVPAVGAKKRRAA